MRRVAVFFAAMLAIAGTAAAQQTTGNSTAARWEWGAYFGAGRDNVTGPQPEGSQHRTHALVAARATGVIFRRGGWSVMYAPEIAPIFTLSNTPRSHMETLTSVSGDTFDFEFEDEPGLAFGLAVAPLGVETQFRWSPNWRVYAGGTLGGVWFTRPVPAADGSGFNYTADWGGGVMRDVSPNTSLRFGYTFHRLSNNFTGSDSAAVDGHLVTIGFMWRKVS